MQTSLFFRVADISIELLSNNSNVKIGLEGATKKFIIEEGTPDIKIEAEWGDLSAADHGKLIFDSGELWKLYIEKGSYCFRFASLAMGAHPYKMATFDKEFHSGGVCLHETYFDQNRPVYPLEYPLDELMINNFLARGRVVEIHACGVVDSNGNGHLFVGQSTAGKTTMARLWVDEPGVEVLSDDRIILRKMENKIWMYGTPWHGEAMLASPNRVLLTAIYFLEKGSKNEVKPEKISESVGRLFACSFPPFYNREALDFTLGFMEGVVKSTPCYELRFKPEKSVVEYLAAFTL